MIADWFKSVWISWVLVSGIYVYHGTTVPDASAMCAVQSAVLSQYSASQVSFAVQSVQSSVLYRTECSTACPYPSLPQYGMLLRFFAPSSRPPFRIALLTPIVAHCCKQWSMALSLSCAGGLSGGLFRHVVVLLSVPVLRDFAAVLDVDSVWSAAQSMVMA